MSIDDYIGESPLSNRELAARERCHGDWTEGDGWVCHRCAAEAPGECAIGERFTKAEEDRLNDPRRG